MLGTSNFVNHSRRNLKRIAKYVYHTGTLVSLIAHMGTSCIKKEGESEIHQVYDGPSFNSGKDDLTDIDMVRSRETGNAIRLIS